MNKKYTNGKKECENLGDVMWLCEYELSLWAQPVFKLALNQPKNSNKVYGEARQKPS